MIIAALYLGWHVKALQTAPNMIFFTLHLHMHLNVGLELQTTTILNWSTLSQLSYGVKTKAVSD